MRALHAKTNQLGGQKPQKSMRRELPGCSQLDKQEDGVTGMLTA